MKKMLFLTLPLAIAYADNQEFLFELGNGGIQPAGVVATKADVQVLTGIAQAARGDAILAQNTVDAALEYMSDLAATSNQFGFVNASILSFGKTNWGADTNAWGVVLSIELGQAANGMLPVKLGTWFSGAIDGAPEVITTDNLGTPMSAWELAPILNFTIENNVLIGGTIYDPVYVLELEVPNNPKGFFRTLAKILKGGIGEYFGVQNAVSVGGEVGKDYDIVFNGLRRVTKGGVATLFEVIE